MSEMSWRPGHVVWRELMTTDVAKAKGFYGELLGWGFDDMPMPKGGTYTIAKVGSKGVGGLMGMTPDMKFPPMWTSYVSVPDVDASCAAAKKLGGNVVFGPETMDGVGRMATILDSENCCFAVMRAEKGDMPFGPPALGEFCWETLSSADMAKAKTFYAAVCGWKDAAGTAGMPVLCAPDGTQVVDHQQAQNMPPNFLTYVVVETVEKANARVTALGGKVMMPRIDIPKVGTISVISDPQGAFIGLFKPEMP
ncbi:MAG: VOC family protein [Sandaracinaceae bacterium]|nr:VOC family protein [Sandaracinaceae bacterium]